MAARPCLTYDEFSERYEILYNVATGRGLPAAMIRANYPKLHVGEVILASESAPDDGYQKMAKQHGNVHGFANGVDPHRHGRPHGRANQAYGTVCGLDPFSTKPHLQNPEAPERDDIKHARRKGMRGI